MVKAKSLLDNFELSADKLVAKLFEGAGIIGYDIDPASLNDEELSYQKLEHSRYGIAIYSKKTGELRGYVFSRNGEAGGKDVAYTWKSKENAEDYIDYITRHYFFTDTLKAVPVSWDTFDVSSGDYNEK